MSVLMLYVSVLVLNVHLQALRAASYRASAGLCTILQPIYRKSAAAMKANYLVGFIAKLDVNAA
jgi:hypothetical protein